MKDSCETKKPCLSTVLIKVALGGFAIWAVGMLWYSDATFGKAWMRLAGLDPEAVKQAMQAEGMKIMGISMLHSLAASFALHVLYCMANAVTLGRKLAVSLVASAGVIGVTLFGGVIWEHKPVELFLLNTGYYVVAYCVAAVMSSLIWRKSNAPAGKSDSADGHKGHGCCSK